MDAPAVIDFIVLRMGDLLPLTRARASVVSAADGVSWPLVPRRESPLGPTASAAAPVLASFHENPQKSCSAAISSADVVRARCDPARSRGERSRWRGRAR